MYILKKVAKKVTKTDWAGNKMAVKGYDIYMYMYTYV
jgi:hypothetical protein